MPDPVIETITARIAHTVGTITFATGYDTDLQRVYRSIRPPGTADELPYACVVASDEDDEFGSPSGFYQCRRSIEVYVFVSGEDAATDTILNKAEADVKKALAADTQLQGGQDGTLPNLAWLRASGMQRVPVEYDGPWIEGVLVTFVALYHHLEANPYGGRSG